MTLWKSLVDAPLLRFIAQKIVQEYLDEQNPGAPTKKATKKAGQKPGQEGGLTREKRLSSGTPRGALEAFA